MRAFPMLGPLFSPASAARAKRGPQRSVHLIKTPHPQRSNSSFNSFRTEAMYKAHYQFSILNFQFSIFIRRPSPSPSLVGEGRGEGSRFWNLLLLFSLSLLLVRLNSRAESVPLVIDNKPGA